MKCKVVYGNGRTTKDRYYIDGKEVSKKKFDSLCASKFTGDLQNNVPPATMSLTGWPRRSDALGTSPRLKSKVEAHFAKLGVPTEIDGTSGEAIIRDNAHQRDLLKAMGWVNKDGGYGSVTG